METISASTLSKRGGRKIPDAFRQKKKIDNSDQPKPFPSSLPHIFPSMNCSFIEMRKEDMDNKSEAEISFSDVVEDNAKILSDVPNCSIDVPNVSIISSTVPCRNLMDQFETIEVSSLNEEEEKQSPEDRMEKPHRENSPKSVDAFDFCPEIRYVFSLIKALQLSLTQETVNRVSFYAVIRDINQELSSLVTNEPKQPNADLKQSALVAAVSAPTMESFSFADESVSSPGTVLIDEEHWMLTAINSSSKDKFEPGACPPGFAAAIGEEDLTISANNSDRHWNGDSKTQLWKPSRSWWEARSGRNPWIDPNSHNKRWRYLWPLIHYHKFLAKCIKKLKRNSVDIITSPSPVCAFLREEVCEISEHLATVSKFSAEEWVEALQHFQGWTEPSPEAETKLRAHVGQLKLRSDCDDVDVCSLQSRNQVDKSFVKAIAAAKEQMINGVALQRKLRSIAEEETNPECDCSPPELELNRAENLTIMNNPSDQNIHQKIRNQNVKPPIPMIKNNLSNKGKNNKRRETNRKKKNASSPLTQQPLNNDSYHPFSQNNIIYTQYAPYPYYAGDNLYVNLPTNYALQTCPDYQYPPHNFHPMNFNSYSQMHYPPPYDTAPNSGSQLVHPSCPVPSLSKSILPKSPNESDTTIPPTPNRNEIDQNLQPIMKTPYKQTSSPSNQQPSPFWGHLDHGTLAMAGLVTPGGLTSPHPSRLISTIDHRPIEHGEVRTFSEAQLWMNPNVGYYHHQQHGVPPSPATQFMMGTYSNNVPFHAAVTQVKTQASEGDCTTKKKEVISTPKKQEQ